jgi:hypothetical protein
LIEPWNFARFPLEFLSNEIVSRFPFSLLPTTNMSNTTPQPEDGFYALVTGANRYVQTLDIVVPLIDTFIQAV